MNYFKYIPIDVVNGPGTRCSLFVSGCCIHCPDCFNKATWSYKAGFEFTQDNENQIISDLNDKRIHRRGFSILGGEPLDPRNIVTVNKLLKDIRSNTDKDIWLWTGYKIEDMDLYQLETIKLCDTVIDGPFIKELKDPKLWWRGSSNQQIINIKEMFK